VIEVVMMDLDAKAVVVVVIEDVVMDLDAMTDLDVREVIVQDVTTGLDVREVIVQDVMTDLDVKVTVLDVILIREMSQDPQLLLVQKALHLPQPTEVTRTSKDESEEVERQDLVTVLMTTKALSRLNTVNLRDVLELAVHKLKTRNVVVVIVIGAL